MKNPYLFRQLLSKVLSSLKPITITAKKYIKGACQKGQGLEQAFALQIGQKTILLHKNPRQK